MLAYEEMCKQAQVRLTLLIPNEYVNSSYIQYCREIYKSLMCLIRTGDSKSHLVIFLSIIQFALLMVAQSNMFVYRRKNIFIYPELVMQ